MSLEMKEMKGMLKLLVDTQMEMQRAIRQEVNAMMRSSTSINVLRLMTVYSEFETGQLHYTMYNVQSCTVLHLSVHNYTMYQVTGNIRTFKINDFIYSVCENYYV